MPTDKTAKTAAPAATAPTGTANAAALPEAGALMEAGTVTAVGSTVQAGLPEAPRTAPSLTLGTHVMVKLADGSMLRNNESGGFFEANTPTPQTVTVTLLRRLQDGALVLC